MNEQTLSKYKNHVTASRKQVFLANFADYLLTFILTFVLFAVAGYPIFSSLPTTQSSFVEANEHVKRYYSIIETTRLQRYDPETVTLSKIQDDAKLYVTSLVKTSYFINAKQYPHLEEGTYVMKDIPLEETLLYDNNGDYPNETLAYYFLTFKSSHSSIDFYVYDGVDYRNNKETYLYEKAFGYTQERFEAIRDDVTIYRQLSFNQAELIMHYLVYGDTSDAINKAYNPLADAYIKACGLFIDEVQVYYDAFIEENASFAAIIEAYDLSLLLDFLFCYLAAMLILEIILPLFLKEGRTLGLRAFKLSYATKDDLTPNYLRFLMKTFMRVLIYPSVAFFIMLIMGSTSLAFVSFGWFNFAMLYLTSGLLGIGSIVLEMVLSTRQGIPELVSGLIIKDTTTLEQGTPLENETEGK